MNDKLSKVANHPLMTGGVILSLIALVIGGVKAANNLENQVNANASDIEHNEEKRAQDRKDFKEDLKEIKGMLNQLLVK